VPPTPVIAPVAPLAATSSIDARIAASEDLITATQGRGFTVQLLAIRAPAVERLVGILGAIDAASLGGAPVLVNNRAYNGVLHHAIYIGQFGSSDEAARFIGNLPDELRRQKPFIRSFAKILEEPRS
jgi:septal ring-binding cell division protein DamX